MLIIAICFFFNQAEIYFIYIILRRHYSGTAKYRHMLGLGREVGAKPAGIKVLGFWFYIQDDLNLHNNSEKDPKHYSRV